MIDEKDIPPKTKQRILELLATINYSLIEVRNIMTKLTKKKKHKKRDKI